MSVGTQIEFSEADLSQVEDMVIQAQVALEEEIVAASPKLAEASELKLAKFYRGVLEASAALELSVLRTSHLFRLDPDRVNALNIQRHTAGRLVSEEYLRWGGLSPQAQYLMGSRVSFHTDGLELLGVSQNPFPGVF